MKLQNSTNSTLSLRILFSFLFSVILTLTSFSQVNMSNTTISTCNDIIYDDGGPGGNYTENNYEMIVCASSGTELYLVLQMLDLGAAFNGDTDILMIYEGTGTGGAVLFNSETDPAPTGILMSNDPCITITIDTDPHFFSTPVAGGFELLVSCTVPETCSDGILNNGEVQIDCGGPNCSPCYQPTSCGGVIVQNGDFETIDAFGCANNTDSEIHSNATSVEHWFGTTEEAGPQGGITPDYWTIAGCGISPNINGSVGPCNSGQGALGFFPAREEVQSQLAEPLVAGQEYCLTVDIASNSANAATADLFFWFHNRVFSNGTGIYDLVADNGGGINIVTGPIGATPQIVNDPTNVFSNTCNQFTSSFCADGGESYIVVGGSYATGITYLIIDNLVVSEACPLDFDSDIVAIGTPDCAGSCIDLVAQTANQSGGCEVTNDFDFQWYENGVLMPGETDDTLLSVCPSGAVTYSVEITYSAGCRSYTKPAVETSISFCGAFSIVVDATPPTICEGECTDLSVAPSPAGVYTYSWTEQGDPTEIGNTDVLNVCPTTTTIYEVEVSDGVNTLVGSVEVFVTPQPSIDAGVDQTVCDGDQVTLTGINPDGATLSWDNGAIDGSPFTPGLGTTTYTVTADLGGCVSTDQVDVTVNESPTFTLSSTNPTICGALDGTITISGLIPGEDYDISFNGGGVVTITADGSGEIVLTGLGAGSYTGFEVSIGGCNTIDSGTINLSDPNPPSIDAGINQTVCEGDEVTLTATNPDGATLSWNNGVIDGTPFTPGVGTTTYTVTADLGGCISTDQVDVTVHPSAVIDAGADVSICAGGSTDLSATGGVLYTWDNGIGAGAGPHTVSPITTTVYTVTGEDANGCEGTAQVTVTVDGTGAVLTVTGTDVSCFGDTDGSATVVATGTGPFTYIWQPTGGSSDVATGLSPGTYTIEVTDGNGCVSNETIEIDEPVELTLATSSTDSDCTIDNGTATVVANGGTGAYSYSWTPSGQTTATANNLGAGSYEVVVTDDNGCQSTANVSVGNVNGPVITVDAVNDVSCAGEADGSATVSVSGGTPVYTYDWSPSGGVNPSATGLTPGNYTITVTDAAGCVSFEDVVIGEPSPISITGVVTDSDCGLDNGLIATTASGGTGIYTYTWLPNVSTTADASDLEPNDYTVTVTDANGCSVDETFTVGIIDGLGVTITPSVFSINQGDNVDLIVTVNPNLTDLTYTWIPSDGLSCSDCPNPTASPNETTTYTVFVTSEDGCEGEATVTIFVEFPCLGAHLPTVFSPNDDGANDRLCVLSSCLESMDLSIYNRWGERVFQSNDINDCWDGRHRDELVNSGVFVYKLRVTLTNGETIEDSGNVTVVR